MSVQEKKPGGLSELWQTEDWWSIWVAVIFIIGIMIAWINKPTLTNKWGTEEVPSILGSINGDMISGIILTGIICILAFGLSIYFTDRPNLKKFFMAFPIIFGLALIAEVLGSYSPLKYYGVNNVVWALIIGLIISNTVKTPKIAFGAVKTELYVKAGLVLLGASILFDRLLTMGVMGLGVAWMVTPVVLITMYWFSQKVLKMHDTKGLAMTLSAATSVCGVSAAISAGAAAKAKKEEISLAISVSLIFTVIMMVAMPAFVKFTGMDPLIGGAWLGGTIDSTGAVVAAGAVLGQDAMEVASVVKMVQNVMIGFIAFAIAIFFVMRYEGKSAGASNVGAKEIWIRMPKFILVPE